MPDSSSQLPPNPNSSIHYPPESLKVIVLAAGHFWGVQAFFSRLEGVCECEAGYANGDLKTPDFYWVDRGKSGCAFAVRLKYDPDRLPLIELINIFFDIIKPCSIGHQGPDWGPQYRTGVYYCDEQEKAVIQQVFEQRRGALQDRITTELQPLYCFYPAEPEQQNYLESHPTAYCSIDLSYLRLIDRRKQGVNDPSAGSGEFAAADLDKERAVPVSSGNDEAVDGSL